MVPPWGADPAVRVLAFRVRHDFRARRSSVQPELVNAFDLTGRVNVRVENKAYPGRIHWQHGPESDELWLYSPVGSGVARMRQDASGAVLIASDGKEYRAQDLKLLTRKVLGWDLPLDGLQYWVRGLPWPALGYRRAAVRRRRATEAAEAGRLAGHLPRLDTCRRVGAALQARSVRRQVCACGWLSRTGRSMAQSSDFLTCSAPGKAQLVSAGYRASC